MPAVHHRCEIPALIGLLLGLALLLGPGPAAAAWMALEPGLDWAELEAPMPAPSGDSIIRVLRIDPARFSLRLLNASAAPEHGSRTPRAWGRAAGLVAAINAGMYATDYRTNVSLMQTKDHVNNARVTRDNAVLAFDRIDAEVPPVQIIDRTCQDFPTLRTRYTTLVQSIRMVSCTGRNVWSPQDRRYSTAAIGMDLAGRVLFIHAGSPWSTHDLVENLLALPIDLKNAMYVEGGRQAQLWVEAGGREIELVGDRVGAGSASRDDTERGWPVPNVIGVVPGSAAGAP